MLQRIPKPGNALPVGTKGSSVPQLYCHCVFGPMSSCLQELWEVGQWAETSALDNTAFQSRASLERERDGTVLELVSFRWALAEDHRISTSSRRTERGAFGVGVLERERERDEDGAPGLQTVSCCECQNNKTAQVQMDAPPEGWPG